MTSNYNIIDVKKNNRVKTINVTFNKLKIYITIYHTYPLLYYKGHIQMIRNLIYWNIGIVTFLHIYHLFNVHMYMVITN